MSIILGIFLILHAFVHLLYAGQALRFFELRPGLAWPAGAWAFSRLLGDPAARWLAAVSLALAALGFLSAGLGLFFGAGWARTVTIGAAGLSMLIYLLFEDGKFHAMPEEGGLACSSTGDFGGRLDGVEQSAPLKWLKLLPMF